mmetsp:Transcript_111472/g.193422  ORF Transcript_111472/g.193422 Transcript_111472/m.193422 type:complete len:315 (+) Transcript_111472:128-1072(+)
MEITEDADAQQVPQCRVQVLLCGPGRSWVVAGLLHAGIGLLQAAPRLQHFQELPPEAGAHGIQRLLELAHDVLQSGLQITPYFALAVVHIWWASHGLPAVEEDLLLGVLQGPHGAYLHQCRLQEQLPNQVLSSRQFGLVPFVLTEQEVRETEGPDQHPVRHQGSQGQQACGLLGGGHALAEHLLHLVPVSLPGAEGGHGGLAGGGHVRGPPQQVENAGIGGGAHEQRVDHGRPVGQRRAVMQWGAAVHVRDVGVGALLQQARYCVWAAGNNGTDQLCSARGIWPVEVRFFLCINSTAMPRRLQSEHRGSIRTTL